VRESIHLGLTVYVVSCDFFTSALIPETRNYTADAERIKYLRLSKKTCGEKLRAAHVSFIIGSASGHILLIIVRPEGKLVQLDSFTGCGHIGR
jgi:hypothetical protein